MVVEDLSSTQEMGQQTLQPKPVVRPELPGEEGDGDTLGAEKEVVEPEQATICDVDPSVFNSPPGYGTYRAGQVITGVL